MGCALRLQNVLLYAAARRQCLVHAGDLLHSALRSGLFGVVRVSHDMALDRHIAGVCGVERGHHCRVTRCGQTRLLPQECAGASARDSTYAIRFFDFRRTSAARRNECAFFLFLWQFQTLLHHSRPLSRRVGDAHSLFSHPEFGSGDGGFLEYTILNLA